MDSKTELRLAMDKAFTEIGNLNSLKNLQHATSDEKLRYDKGIETTLTELTTKVTGILNDKIKTEDFDSLLEELLKENQKDRLDILSSVNPQLYADAMSRIKINRATNEMKALIKETESNITEASLQNESKIFRGTLKAILRDLSDKEKQNALKGLDLGDLFDLFKNRRQHILQSLDLAGSKQFRELVTSADKNGNTLLHQLANDGDDLGMVLALSFYPKEQAAPALTKKNEKGETPVILLESNRAQNPQDKYEIEGTSGDEIGQNFIALLHQAPRPTVPLTVPPKDATKKGFSFGIALPKFSMPKMSSKMPNIFGSSIKSAKPKSDKHAKLAPISDLGPFKNYLKGSYFSKLSFYPDKHKQLKTELLKQLTNPERTRESVKLALLNHYAGLKALSGDKKFKEFKKYLVDYVTEKNLGEPKEEIKKLDPSDPNAEVKDVKAIIGIIVDHWSEVPLEHKTTLML